MMYVELLRSLLSLLSQEESQEPAPQYHTKVSVSSGPFFPPQERAAIFWMAVDLASDPRPLALDLKETWNIFETNETIETKHRGTG